MLGENAALFAPAQQVQTAIRILSAAFRDLRVADGEYNP
jgi:hypothetical protein